MTNTIPLRSALSVAIGQNLLLNGLATKVPEQTDAVSAGAVIAVGAAGLSQLTSSPEILYALRVAYSEAVRYTFLLALAAACFAFPFSCAMEQLNIKRIAKERSKSPEPNGCELDAPLTKKPPYELVEFDEGMRGGTRKAASIPQCTSSKA